MSGKHLASFTWGAGPNTVAVAGGFNDWSATASPLAKQADGTFSAQIPLEYGSRHALKYVVDGEWKVREDEAKEWDAAGNCNNVYTSPAAPLTSTEPSTLLAASAPTAASTGAAAPATTAPSAASTGGATTGAGLVDLAGGKASSAQPVPSLGSQILPDAREKTAATSNVGAAGSEPTILEKAAEAGGAAAAALGAVIGSAVASVEKATGVELTTGNPLTLDEAKAKGINVDALEKKELPTDAVSPVGSKPPASGADALSEKLATLRTDVPPTAAAVENKPNDIPAQHETTDNHKTVPAPAIAAVSEKDPLKDRTQPAAASADAAKAVSTSPAAGAKEAKREEESSKPPAVVAAPVPASSTPAPAPAATSTTGSSTAPTAATGSTTAAAATTAASTAAVTAAAAADAAPATDAKSKNAQEYVDPKDKSAAATAPKTPAKEAHPTASADSAFPGKLPETPAKTPAKANGSASAATATPASNKTATSTPNKSVKKKKSSFFGKLKQAFSPKDKEKK